MPRRKQARRMTVQDIRTILRLAHQQGLSVREIGLRLKLSNERSDKISGGAKLDADNPA